MNLCLFMFSFKLDIQDSLGENVVVVIVYEAII